MNFIYTFDIFSRKPRLKIDGNSRIRNIYISIIGIFLILGYIAVTIYLSSNLMGRENFNIIENTNSKTFNNITLDDDFQIIAILTDMLGVELIDHKRIFDLQLHYFLFFPGSSNQTSNTINTKISNKNCKHKRLPGDEDDTIEKKIRNYNSSIKCYDLNSYNLSILGDDNPLNTQGSLVFYINQCVNITAESNCLPQIEIDRKLREVKLAFLFQNTEINNKQLNPFIKYTKGSVFRFSNSLKTRYTFELDTIEFLSDDGLFFENIKTFRSFQIGDPSIMQNIALGSILYPGTIGNINFYGSGKKRIYQRRYEKFHSIFPYLVSIYQMVYLIFKLLATYLGGGRLDEFIFSKLIEKEEFDKFKAAKREINYDDLFKEIKKDESRIEKEENDFQPNDSINKVERKQSNENINSSGISKAENKDYTLRNNYIKEKNKENKKLENNFFPKEEQNKKENKKELKEKSTNLQKNGNEIQKQEENSDGNLFPERINRNEGIFKMKRNIKNNLK